MSILGEPRRADARRNLERILDAAAERIAVDVGVSLEQIATAAGVSRSTLYHHFAGRDALLDALTARSVAEVSAAIAAARPDEGRAGEALERVLLAAWQVVGRYRGLVIINPQRLERAELRVRLGPALGPVRALIRRGQAAGEFDAGLPVEWLLGLLTDVIHAASRQVTAGAMDVAAAERAMLRSATALLARPSVPRRQT